MLHLTEAPNVTPYRGSQCYTLQRLSMLHLIEAPNVTPHTRLSMLHLTEAPNVTPRTRLPMWHLTQGFQYGGMETGKGKKPPPEMKILGIYCCRKFNIFQQKKTTWIQVKTWGRPSLNITPHKRLTSPHTRLPCDTSNKAPKVTPQTKLSISHRTLRSYRCLEPKTNSISKQIQFSYRCWNRAVEMCTTLICELQITCYQSFGCCQLKNSIGKKLRSYMQFIQPLSVALKSKLSAICFRETFFPQLLCTWYIFIFWQISKTCILCADPSGALEACMPHHLQFCLWKTGSCTGQDIGRRCPWRTEIKWFHTTVWIMERRKRILTQKKFQSIAVFHGIKVFFHEIILIQKIKLAHNNMGICSQSIWALIRLTSPLLSFTYYKKKDLVASHVHTQMIALQYFLTYQLNFLKIT